MRAIRTVGHGTLAAGDFVDLMRNAGLEVVIDVRRFPGSRRSPHFGTKEMKRWLSARDIDYHWLDSLGGRRQPTSDSPNVGLRNPQFRAYADHMASPEFADGVAQLETLARARPAAIMCAEAVWWRCHRRLLADHLTLVSAERVEHLFHDGRLVRHPMTPPARRAGGHVVYDRVDVNPISAGGTSNAGSSSSGAFDEAST